MNWKTALADYANYLRIERGLSSNTIKNYTLDVQKLSGWLDEHAIAVSPAKIEPEQIQQFIFKAGFSTAAAVTSDSVDRMRLHPFRPTAA